MDFKAIGGACRLIQLAPWGGHRLLRHHTRYFFFPLPPLALVPASASAAWPEVKLIPLAYSASACRWGRMELAIPEEAANDLKRSMTCLCGAGDEPKEVARQVGEAQGHLLAALQVDHHLLLGLCIPRCHRFLGSVGPPPRLLAPWCRSRQHEANPRANRPRRRLLGSLSGMGRAGSRLQPLTGPAAAGGRGTRDLSARALGAGVTRGRPTPAASAGPGEAAASASSAAWARGEPASGQRAPCSRRTHTCWAPAANTGTYRPCCTASPPPAYVSGQS